MTNSELEPLLMAGGERSYLPPAGASDYLVLDVAAQLKQFCDQTRPLCCVGKEEYVEHYVDDLLQYMLDRDEVQDYVAYYLAEQYRLVVESSGVAVAQQFTEALEALAVQIRDQLTQAQAWDQGGMLPYCFDHIAGWDLVLRRVGLWPQGMCQDG